MEPDSISVADPNDHNPQPAPFVAPIVTTGETAIAVTAARECLHGQLLRERRKQFETEAEEPKSTCIDSAESATIHVGFDARALQSAHHQHRGIGRYVYESLSAQTRIGAEERGFAARYYFDVDVPTGRRLERFNEIAPLEAMSASSPGLAPDLWHIASPMEPDWGVDQLFPVPFRRSLLAVTCFDLIPLLMPERYLPTEGIRRSYDDRLELVRQADLVLCISQSTANDVRERLDVPASRIAVVGAGVSPVFNDKPDADFEALLDHHLGHVRRYLFLVGGEDPRKNIERGISAFAALPAPLRSDLHLVIGGFPQAGLEPRLAAMTDRLAITDRVIGLGRVSDSALKAIYQQAALVVFPSEYEGFGFPALEALRCGTDVVVSNTSSLIEVVPDPDRRFDPTSVRSITDCIARQLTGTPTSASDRTEWLLPHSWDAVARRTAVEFSRLISSKENNRLRRSARLAVVSPLPPARTGVADYVDGLRAGFTDYVSTTFFGEEGAPNAVPFGSFDDWEAVHGSFDGVLVQIGNNEAHLPALDLLRRHPGRCTVEVHDARLIGLYDQEGVRAGDLTGRWVPNTIRTLYGDTYADRVQGVNLLDPDQSQEAGVWLIREVCHLARRVVVHTTEARNVVLRDQPQTIVDVVPLSITRRTPPTTVPGFIATAGVVAKSKNLSVLLEAFTIANEARPGLTLGIIGPGVLDDAVGKQNVALKSLRDKGVLREYGHLARGAYFETLGSAAAVVQLRRSTNGEASAAVSDAIGLGRSVIGDQNSLAGAPAGAIRLTRGDANTVAAAILDALDSPDTESWIDNQQNGESVSPLTVARQLAEIALSRPEE